MRAAWPWSRGELRRGWRSLALITLLAALAGGGVAAAVAGARRADTVVDRHRDHSGWPPVTAFATEPIPEVTAWLDSDPRVTDVIEVRFLAATPTHLTPGLNGGTAVATAPSSIERLWIIDGRLPSGPGELAVSERTAAAEGIGVGDRLPFHYVGSAGLEACVTGEGECPEPEEMGSQLITGVLRVPGELAPDPYDQGFFLAGADFTEPIGSLDELTQQRIVGAYLHDPDDAAAVTADLSVRLPNGDAIDETAALEPARRAAGVHAAGLRVGAAVAGAIALVVLFQAVTRHLGGRRTEAGVLAALGLDRRSRAVAAAAPVALAALPAAAGTVAIGLAASAAIPFGLARQAEPDPGLHADWVVLAVGGLLVLLAMVTAGLVAGWRWAAPAVAGGRPLRQATAVSQLASRLALAPVPTTGARFALESGPGPSRISSGQVVVAIAAALAVVFGAFVMRASLHGLQNTPARFGAPWDLQISYPSTPEAEALVDRLAEDSRVEAAAVAAAGELTLRADDRAAVQATALGIQNRAGSVEPSLLEGRLPRGPNEVLVGTDTMRDLGLRLGDTVVLEGASDDGDEPVRLTAHVVGRVIVPVVGNGNTDRGVVLALDAFEALGGAQLVAEVDAERALLLRIPDTSDQRSMAAEIEERDGALVDRPFRPGAVTVLEELDMVPMMLAGFTALLAALAVAHALTVAVRRRRGELAVLRALGFAPRQAAGAVRWQSLTLAGVALLVGIPFGIIGGRAVWQGIAGSSNVVPVVDVGPGLIAVTALVVVAVALALAILPGVRAARLRPAEALRSE
jgi:ABC-type lipoprotein release transport system permease subunit